MMSALESNIVAVERVKEYSKTETEVRPAESLGQGEPRIAGEGCLVARHPCSPRPGVQAALSSFI